MLFADYRWRGACFGQAGSPAARRGPRWQRNRPSPPDPNQPHTDSQPPTRNLRPGQSQRPDLPPTGRHNGAPAARKFRSGSVLPEAVKIQLLQPPTIVSL